MLHIGLLPITYRSVWFCFWHFWFCCQIKVIVFCCVVWVSWYCPVVSNGASYTELCVACSSQTQTAACIQMPTVLPAKTRTWPDVVSMLVQRRWRWANIETTLGRNLVFAGLHTGVCLHPTLPLHNISASRSRYFSKTAGQSQAYYNTWNWEWGTYDVIHLQILTCEVAVSTAGSVMLSNVEWLFRICLIFSRRLSLMIHDKYLIGTSQMSILASSEWSRRLLCIVCNYVPSIIIDK